MAIIKVFGVTFFLLFLSGCTYQYAQEATRSLSKKAGFIQNNNIERYRNIAIDSMRSIHVTTLGQDPIIEEFPEIVRELEVALSRYAKVVSFDDPATNFEDSIAYAQSNHVDFLVVMKIIKFSSGVSSVIEIDRRFRGKQTFGFDRIEMQLQIVDVNKEVVVDSTYITSKSPFFQVTRLNAVDLLATMFDDYSRLLFNFQSVRN